MPLFLPGCVNGAEGGACRQLGDVSAVTAGPAWGLLVSSPNPEHPQRSFQTLVRAITSLFPVNRDRQSKQSALGLKSLFQLGVWSPAAAQEAAGMLPGAQDAPRDRGRCSARFSPLFPR